MTPSCVRAISRTPRSGFGKVRTSLCQISPRNSRLHSMCARALSLSLSPPGSVTRWVLLAVPGTELLTRVTHSGQLFNLQLLRNEPHFLHVWRVSLRTFPGRDSIHVAYGPSATRPHRASHMQAQSAGTIGLLEPNWDAINHQCNRSCQLSRFCW